MINKKNSTSLPTLSDKIRILVIGDSSVGKVKNLLKKHYWLLFFFLKDFYYSFNL